ncbi:MAG: pyridoxal phosphate-dependent aminotransferase [Marinilabiliales bacterium]|nr:MAG: pyridoxal phosphate-dependent aminotransferase [Marinilabiliales bacterium]
MKKRIWLSPPHMGVSEINYVKEAFDTNWIAPLGPNVDQFERDLIEYTGVGHAAALSSGTAAIHLALILAGVKAGDEVITSTFTFSATVNPIVYQGAIPILIDSESGTWNMDPDLLEKSIKERIRKGKKPKAIILVHLYGMPAQVDEIKDMADQYEIPLIEDAAEALGSTYKEKALGTYGLMGVLSFNGNKIITTSGGGALISDNKELIDKSRFLATQARDDAPHYQHSEVGYNYRMSNVLAGIGRGQMEVLDDHIKLRRSNFQYYKDHLSKYEGMSFLEEPNKDYLSNYWLTCILVNPAQTRGITREDIRLALQDENIEARPLWKPMHLQPVFKDYPYYGGGTSEKLFEIGLCLPSGSNMTDEDRGRVLKTITKTLEKIKLR